MRKVAVIFLLLVLSQSALCQFQSYTIRNYKAIDGLPQSQANIMLEDKNGYLWIGTEGGGLARFDGREFKVYTTLDGLLSNIVTFLKLDSKGNLWIIHPRGITKFDGITFKRFVQPGSPTNVKRIRRVFEIKDTVFVVTAPGQIGKIYSDSVFYWSRPVRGNVLLHYCHLAPNRDVLLYLSDSTFYLKTDHGDYAFRHDERFNRLYGLIFNYRNEVWIRTDSGYFTIDFEKRDFVRRELPIKNGILQYDSLNDVFWTRSGNMVLKEKITAQGVSADTVLNDVSVKQILVDSEGNTWFATDGAGLYKYFNQDFSRYCSDALRGVMAVHIDRDGNQWIGTMTQGVWKKTGSKLKSYWDKREPFRNAVTSIAESAAGELWIGSAFGLGKYDEANDKFNWYTRDDGLSHSAIYGLDFDRTGRLWVGTHGGGVNVYDGKNFKAFTAKDGLSSNTVNALRYAPYHEKVFIGNEFGLSAIKGNVIEQIKVDEFENTGVISINIMRDSLLLIGSAGAGFVIYDPTSKFRKLFTTHQGLPSDFVYFVVADNDEFVWVGTEKGITRLRLSDNFEIIENRHFDYENGLEGVETNQNAYVLTSDYKLFGLIDGIYRFNNVKQSYKPFSLHLTDIEILYGEYSARDHADTLWGFFKIPLNAELPSDRNHITFHFNRVDKRYPKSIQFKYFLENFDNKWSQPSSTDHVTYSNLPPGKYVFRVASTNNEGNWSPDQVSYAFTVKAPFYQTASFIIGMIVLLVGAVTLFFYIRVRQRINQVIMIERIRIKEQETLRKEIARDFHDEMGNQLTRIINYISLLKLNGHANGNGSKDHGHHDLYTKVETSAKYLYTGTRDFIWSIDPVNDELSKLFIHIRDFGEKLFEEKNIRFRAYNEVKEKTSLPYGFSREANLIFKEAMTNAFKYSNAGNVSLSLQRNEDGFEMKFEDDGIGFVPGEVAKSNGLKNIRERSERIRATLQIQSVKNQGTRIVLHFKINKSAKHGATI